MDTTHIKIVYPAALDAIVSGAVTAWKNVLQRWGLTNLVFDTVAGGECVPTDPHCILLGEGIVNCNPGVCGCSRYTGISAAGEYTKMTEISIKPGMSDVSHKTWVVGHELGHLLGLEDADQCTAQDSVMKTAACDTPPPSGAGFATDKDALPVAKTVYPAVPGTGSTMTCGWAGGSQ